MVLKNLVVVTPRGFNIVNFIVFLSLISGTAISAFGINSSGSIVSEKSDSYGLVRETKPLESKISTKKLQVNEKENSEPRLEETFTSKDQKALIRRQTEDRTEAEVNGPCRNFVVDVAVKHEFEFFSPGHAFNQPYPSRMDCVKIITAPPGHLLRLDFRNEFHLEQSEDCRFDYLEVRDGAHGYSDLIGSYCGNKHPPPITSSDRHLWLRFTSDENIQYSGFHAVYWYIPRPTNSDQHPEMDVCQIEVNGNEGFANKSDINENRIRFSVTYGLPLDCMWIISVQQGWKIMLQFLKFRLDKPNDCESNFIDVFSDRTDLPSRLKNFCGSIADSVISKSNVLHLRFFAEARSINSTFEALFTAFREKPRDEACEEDEYDCEDATCISIDLKCNGRINCRFRWDENECQPKLGAFAVIFESEHIIIILVVFCLILSGMCFAFLFNCTKKLIRDHRIIQAHLRQSRENEMNIATGSKEITSETRTATANTEPISPYAGSISYNSLNGSFNRVAVKSSPQESKTIEDERNLDCTGDIIPIYHTEVNGSRGALQEDPENNRTLNVTSGPETRDSECQTRESLFSTPSMSSHELRGFMPSLPAAADQNIYFQQISNKSNEIFPFSTFGHPKTTDFGRTRTKAPEKKSETSDSMRFHEVEKINEKRYKAEAVIEVDNLKRGESSGENAVRPFSIDSTKSAPDVIVTH